MTLIDELEKDAWNFIIDELIWHLEEGRIPATVRRVLTPETGIEFCFETVPSDFYAIPAEFLEEHWNEAVTIIGRCPELASLKMCDA